MNYFEFRITTPQDSEEIIFTIDLLKTNLKIIKVLGCYEDPDTGVNKPHHHFYIKTSLKENSVRDIIKKYPKTTQSDYKGGNAHYSLKTIGGTPDDRLNVLKYLCKGKDANTQPIIVINSRLLPQTYNTSILHDMYWTTNKEILKANLIAESKGKNTSIPIPLKIYNKIEKKLIALKHPKPYHIACLIIKDYYQRSCSPPSRFNMEGLVDFITLRYLIEYKNKNIEDCISAFVQKKYEYQKHSEPYETSYQWDLTDSFST